MAGVLWFTFVASFAAFMVGGIVFWAASGIGPWESHKELIGRQE